MTVLDVYSSVVVILIVGWLGSLASQLCRLPRIVCMILFGIALFPVLHPAVMDTALTVSASSGALKVPDAQNPASSIRSLALLIALARGGLSVKFGYFKVLGAAMLTMAVVPYAFELVVQAYAAPLILPARSGFGPGTPRLLLFAGASVWAPLSPSIVIPNMLAFVEKGYTAAGRLVLVGAPLEVSTALLTEGILNSYMTAQNLGANPSLVLYFIPVYILGSAAYGFAWSAVFVVYTKIRKTTRFTSFFGKMDPIEPLLVFLVMFFLCYTTSNDDVNIPRLIGFFSVVCFGVGVQHFVPEVADALCLQLKPIWTFAECFLFVLTGCVIRPAIDGGDAAALFGPFFAVLLLGQLGRMCGDILAGFIWQITLLKRAPWTWTQPEWKDLGGRVVFCWVATIPKATLQASLPVKLSKTIAAAHFGAAAAFVGPAAAIAILYMATIGSLLTFSVGTLLATYFQNKEPKPEKSPDEQELCPPSPIPSRRGSKAETGGSAPKKEKANILTGVPTKQDVFVAPAEVEVDPAHRTPSTWATGTSYADPRPAPAKSVSVPGSERVGPVVNLLTGLEAEDDNFVAKDEVTIAIPHQSPSQYLTGTDYTVDPVCPPLPSVTVQTETSRSELPN